MSQADITILRQMIRDLADKAKAIKDASSCDDVKTNARAIERIADVARTLGVELDDMIDDHRLPEVVLHWDMATSGDLATRGSSWGVWENGWQWFVDAHVWPKIDNNSYGVMIHNPFGRTPGVPMEFRQWQNAQGTPLVEGFAEAFAPIVATGREVVMYTGAIKEDAELVAGLEADEEWAIEAAQDATRPFEDIGTSIGLDALTGIPETSGVWRHVIEPLKWCQDERGLRLFCEPRPLAADNHTFGWDIIARLSDWKLQGNNPKFASNDKLTGSVWLLWYHSGYTPDQMTQFVEEVRKMGHVPIVHGGKYAG